MDILNNSASLKRAHKQHNDLVIDKHKCSFIGFINYLKTKDINDNYILLSSNETKDNKEYKLYLK